MEILYILVGLIVGLGIGWSVRSIVADRQVNEAFKAGAGTVSMLFNEIFNALNKKEENNER